MFDNFTLMLVSQHFPLKVPGHQKKMLKWVLLTKFAHLTSIAVTVKSWGKQQASSADSKVAVSSTSSSSEFSFLAAAIKLLSFTKLSVVDLFFLLQGCTL